MGKRRTKQEVDAEVAALREMLPHVRHRGFFGNNRDAIEAQIAVLDECLDNDDIYDRYDNTEDPESSESLHLITNATAAMEWMDGRSDEKPSDGWKELDQR